MTPEEVNELLRQAGAAKLRGARIRGFDGTSWEAVVAFRRAAELTRTAAESDGAAPPTVVWLSCEAAGLYLDARSPVDANLVLHRLRNVGLLPSVPASLRNRVDAARARLRRDWDRLKRRLPRPDDFENAPLAAIDAIARRYPGVPGFWWALYRVRNRLNDRLGAMDAIERARTLDPSRDTYAAIWISLASDLRSLVSIEEAARGMYAAFGGKSVEFNQLFALYLLDLSYETMDRTEHLIREAAVVAMKSHRIALESNSYLLPRTRELLEYVTRLVPEDPGSAAQRISTPTLPTTRSREVERGLRLSASRAIEREFAIA